MKLLLPIFAVLGLGLAACSGGESAIEVETEIDETTTTVLPTTTTTVAPITTTTLAEAAVPTTTIAAPTTTTAVAVEPVGDGEQVVTQSTDVLHNGVTFTRDDDGLVIVDTVEKQRAYQYYLSRTHPHDTAEGEREHTHVYYTTAPSHYHMNDAIIYIDAWGDEFTYDDVEFQGNGGIYQCKAEGCNKIISETLLESWECPAGTPPARNPQIEPSEEWCTKTFG